VNSIFRIILIFSTITNCSFTPNLKFWSKDKISTEKQENITNIFESEKSLDTEFNSNLNLKFNSITTNKEVFKNLNNNNGRSNFNSNLQNILKYKFSKIENFHQYESEIIFYKNNIIFFENKGSIIQFNDELKLIWKKNYYTKSEQKQQPILSFANNDTFLIVADNINKFYAVNINTGELLWSKKNKSPFNSQIKIYKDKFFIVDFNNILRAYSIKNGEEIWTVKTENTLIRSQKKLSIVITDNKIYFNNSVGDINCIDIKTGELIWQKPTQNDLIFEEQFSLKTSDIIADSDSLYFSNNRNQFFSINLKNGIINWKQKINSSLRPTLIDNYIVTVTKEGYLIIIEKKSGNIIRITDIFKNIKPKIRSKIHPTGFIVGKNSIYLTTSHGRLLIIDLAKGKLKNIIKIDNKNIYRPSFLNQRLYVLTDNSIIILN
jgi:outer membrane protein assembly factor BamB|tara:strand:+ start:105 stop:1406 length:1302 start_codon:yes stop_codon:yes gene_type:complete